MNHYVSLFLINIKFSVQLHALNSPSTELRDQLVICGQNYVCKRFSILCCPVYVEALQQNRLVLSVLSHS
jgi:hypothetical protein